MSIFSAMILLWVLLPSLVWAGGHEKCELCHKDVTKQDYTIIVPPDTKTINPYTAKPFGKRDAICMSCHRDQLDLVGTHSVGVVPKHATMPKEALGFKGQEKELTCESCHDPHPENKNYMYLRWPASPGRSGLNKFCGTCHPGHAAPRH
jgi:hypothetical protein